MANIDDNTQEHLDNLANVIDEKIEKASKASQDNIKNKVDDVVKGEVENLVNKFNEGNDTLNKRIDAIEVENKKSNFNNTFRTGSDAFSDALNKSESFKAMRDGTSQNAGFEIKADVLISGAFSGANSARDVTGVDKLEGIKRDPSAFTNLRDIIPVGNTSSNVIRFVKEASWTDNAAAVAEGSAPTDSEFTLSANDAIVQKLTSVMTISQEMLDDTPALSSYLSMRIPAKINSLLDTQLLTGNGTSPNLQGLLDAAGSTEFDLSSSAAFYQAVESAQELDVIIVALNQLAIANYQASAIVLHPTDFHKMYLLKDTTNEYLRGSSITTADGFFRINGTRVLVNTQMNSGEFIVGDFSQGSQIWQRDGLSVAFGYEDTDNFSKYLVSVRGMMRVAHAIYSGNAYVWGTFSTAKTSIETA